MEDESERQFIGAGGQKIVDAVFDGLLAIHVARGKTKTGEN
jgi:hypothetical protein